MREAEVKRKTKETDIEISLNLDGTGKSEISTGIGFFDHMLEGFSKHGFFDLKIKVKGDLHVDGHHTVEDNPVGKVAIYNSLIPIVGAVTSCLCLGETFHLKYALAGGLAALGIYIINNGKN